MTDADDPNCAIFLETPVFRAELGVCRHKFCLSCIDAWARINPTCPTCKAELVRISFHRDIPRRQVEANGPNAPPIDPDGSHVLYHTVKRGGTRVRDVAEMCGLLPHAVLALNKQNGFPPHTTMSSTLRKGAVVWLYTCAE